jgi:hypothetical protein
MLEFIQHATSGFWVFVGTLILLWVIGYIILAAVAAVAAIFRGR